MATTEPAMPVNVSMSMPRDSQPRDRRDAVEHRGQHRGLDGVDADEVQAQADQHGGSDDPVEVPALLEVEVQALLLSRASLNA